MTDTSREALIKELRGSADLLQIGKVEDWDGLAEEVIQAAKMLEADARYRVICSDYANVQTNEAVRYQKRIRDLEKQVSQQVAVPVLTPLTPQQAHEALTAAGVGTFYMTHAVTRQELWFTEGSTDVMSIVRALEAKHGIGVKP